MATMAKTKPKKPKTRPKKGYVYKAQATPKKEVFLGVREAEPKYMANSKEKDVWQLQEAKAMFCEVVKAAQKKPQIITVHGKKTAVILSYEEYKKDKTPKMSAWEFFRNSPLYGIELDISPRRAEPERDINL